MEPETKLIAIGAAAIMTAAICILVLIRNLDGATTRPPLKKIEAPTTVSLEMLR